MNCSELRISGHRTVKEEFHAVAFRKKLYESLDQLINADDFNQDEVFGPHLHVFQR